MTDLGRRMDQVREHVAPRWSADREQRVLRRTRRRAASVQRWWIAVPVAFSAVALAALIAREPHVESASTTVPAAAQPPTARAQGARAEPTLRLADGTVVTSLSPDTQVVQSAESSDQETLLHLETGVARFDVTPRSDRVVRVVTPDAEIIVLGTRFVVALSDGGTRVSVERGRVALRGKGVEVELGPGQSASAPRVAPESDPASGGGDEAHPPDDSTSVTRPDLAVAAPAPSFVELAEAGDYGAALEVLKASDGAIGSDPAKLLLAADVARLGGEPRRAVPWLQKVVTDHPGDSRAPLAAFTLGRTWLDQLGKPERAAKAFATVRKLSPGGTLAEDALAREVESWARAGDRAHARRRAKEYLEAYPEGRRRQSVERWAGE